jgi:flagellar L-ring protein precursor FlgH
VVDLEGTQRDAKEMQLLTDDVATPGARKRGRTQRHSCAKLVGPLLLSSCVLLQSCAWNTPPATTHQPMTVRPSPRQDLIANAGAIYQPDAGRLILYEDRRARFVGDTITILIQENTSASKKSSANASRNGSTALTVPSVSGLPIGALQGLQGIDVEAASKQSFSGKGDAASNNLFTGSLAVTVIEVLENGNLLVSGEKQVTINQGTEFVRFSGVVNPVYIQADNTVSSTRVADARLEYRGTGYVSEAQTMGWLGRFFMSVWPF